MSSLRETVRQVRQLADADALDSLAAILRDNAAEKAARLAAANFLGRAGKAGQARLRDALTDANLDRLGQVAAFKNLRLDADAPDEVLWAHLLHSDVWRVRRAVEQMLEAMPVSSPTLRLRRLLPEPFCFAGNLEASLAQGLRTERGETWRQIVRAAGDASFAPAVHALIGEMPRRTGEDVALLTRVLIRIGAPAVSPILRALPYSSEPQRGALVDALAQIGDARAIAPLEELVQTVPLHKTFGTTHRRLLDALNVLKSKNANG